MNDNLMGRITALALILGVAYGVHAISRGGLGCPLGNGSCCMMEAPHDEAAEKAAPAKFDADADAGPDAPKNIPAPAPAIK
ncbi:MAG: hypothetical protein ACHQ51_10600 [Elusimicrobiota bacterium]